MAHNAFEFFLGRENARIVDLLERNHDVATVVQGLLEQLVRVADREGVAFDQIVLRDVFVHEGATRSLHGTILIRR